MKTYRAVTILAVVLLACVSMPAQAYQYVSGEDNCRKCHADKYDNATSWHKSHLSYVQNCSACHDADNAVPTKNCKQCHTGLPCRWVDVHREAHENVCAQCHAQACPEDEGEDDETCPAASCLDGSDARLDTLRLFRDKVLAKTEAGRMLIRIYYKTGPGIEKLFDRNPALKACACRLLNASVFIMETFTQ